MLPALLLAVAGTASLASTFTVNDTSDIVDSNPGDGTCATAGGLCTLRAAVQEANAHPGTDTIQVPAGTYLLTLAGSGENSAATGDLDLTDDVTLAGTGTTTTIIDGGGLDRVFEVRTSLAVISGVMVRNGVIADEGAGIRVHGSNSLTLSDVTLTDNDAGDKKGGGVKLSSGTLTMTNVTISNNRSSEGAGLFDQSGPVVMTNVTITDNTAASKGAGISPGSASFTVKNTLVAGNHTAPDCDKSIGPGSNNLDGDGSCGFGTTAAPQLGPLQDNGGPTFTHALLAGSPAIDTGTNSGCPVFDQRGVMRPQDGDLDLISTCDIGAYELVGAGITGHVFEDVNYGGGSGRDLATATAAAAAFTVGRAGATLELYDGTGNYLRSTTSRADGEYGFLGLVAGTYQVRCVNQTVTSSRPGAGAGQWPVQTFRTDASSGVAAAVTDRVGGAVPAGEDSPANLAAANLGTLAAQSVAPVLFAAGVEVSDVDFGFNFDTVVNTNDTGQGSLRQFIVNSNGLTNAGLSQSGLAAGTEHSLFMIPSDADPLGRPQDPGFDAGRGVAVITPDTALPPVTDADTAIDGTTQTAGVGDSNGATLGTGGTVGTDTLALPTLAGPEIEIADDAGLTLGLDLQADRATVRGVAIYGFGSTNDDGDIRVGTGAASSFTGVAIEDNAIGSAADAFTDPDLTLAGSGTGGSHVVILGADSGALRRNLVGFAGRVGVSLAGAADDWTIEQNEVRRNGLDSNRLDGIATTDESIRTIVSRNLVADNQGAGVDFYQSLGNHTVDNNTIEGNGWGLTEPAGVRMFSADSTISHNVIRNQGGAGVLAVVQDPAFLQTPAVRNRVTRNAFSGNGANAIDLQTTLDVIAPGDGITPNDGTLLGDSSVPNACGTDPTHGNNGLDTPVVDLVLLGVGATVRGRACPGAEVEIYRAVADGDGSDALGGADYGEGVSYLTTVTAALGTGQFEATGVAGLSTGDAVAAIAIDGTNDTSEFSRNLPARRLTIVKRAFQIDGAPIASGATLPTGVPVKFLLYIDNPGIPVLDASLEDALDGLFAYRPGSIKVDDSLGSATVCPGGVCDEAAIFAKVDGAPSVCGAIGSECTDTPDADPVSVSGATLHAGDAAEPGNAQLDLPAGKVWAMSFTILMQ